MASDQSTGRVHLAEGPGMRLPGPLISARALDDPLARLLHDIAHHKFPSPDDAVVVLPAPAGPCDVALAFTEHAVVAADVPESWVREHLPAGSGHHHELLSMGFLGALSERLGSAAAGVSILMAAPKPSHPGGPVVELRDSDQRQPDWAAYRSDVRCFEDTDGLGVLNLGLGPGGRWDLWIGFVNADRPMMSPRVVGRAKALLETARANAPDALFASVPSSNARALRTFEAAGFSPVGAEVLFLTRPDR